MKRIPFLIGYMGLSYVASWLAPEKGVTATLDPYFLEYKLKINKEKFLEKIRKTAYESLKSLEKAI